MSHTRPEFEPLPAVRHAGDGIERLQLRVIQEIGLVQSREYLPGFFQCPRCAVAGLAEIASHVESFNGKIAGDVGQTAQGGRAVVVCVRSGIAPLDVQGPFAFQRRLVRTRGDRDRTIVQLRHGNHSGDRQYFILVDGYGSAVEEGPAFRCRVQHSGQSGVDAVDGLTVHLTDRDIPQIRGHLQQRHSDLGAGQPHDRVISHHRRTADGQHVPLNPRRRVRIEFVDGRRKFQIDEIPVDVHFLGCDQRDGGEGAVTHLAGRCKNGAGLVRHQLHIGVLELDTVGIGIDRCNAASQFRGQRDGESEPRTGFQEVPAPWIDRPVHACISSAARSIARTTRG